MSVLILPVAIVIALFSYEIILLWTQNPTIARELISLVSILICGTALNGLMNLPYALQLAFGWTRLSFLKTYNCGDSPCSANYLYDDALWCYWCSKCYGLF